MEFHLIKLLNTVKRIFSVTALTVLITLMISTTVLADNQIKIAVIYPQVRDPYIRIFKEIISGVIETQPYQIEQYGIVKDENLDNIIADLNKKKVNAVILLGNRASKMSSLLEKNMLVVSSAVFSVPAEPDDTLRSSSISMIVSPDVLLKKLSLLAPEVKTVHVVYNNRSDEWVIKQAKEVLKRQGVKLNALSSTDVRGHARLYNDLFKSNSLSITDALWLLQNDDSIKEPRILDSILENAWKQSFIVFSANPNHVRKGVLFAMYPDNKQLGVTLTNKLLSLHAGASKHNIAPLRDLLIAVNIRTAEHLELDFSRSERQSFNMIFPSR